MFFSLIQAGNTVKFRLTINEGSTMDWYYYIVLANGVPVLSAQENYSTSDTIEIHLTAAHAPMTTLLVYGQMDEELIADSATFNVKGLFTNQVCVYSMYSICL